MAVGYERKDLPPGWYTIEGGGPLQGGIEENVPADPYGSSESPYYDSRSGPGSVMGGGYWGSGDPGIDRGYTGIDANGNRGVLAGYNLRGDPFYRQTPRSGGMDTLEGGSIFYERPGQVPRGAPPSMPPRYSTPPPGGPYGGLPSGPPLQGNVSLTELHPQIDNRVSYNEAPKKYQPTAAPSVNLPPLLQNPGVNVPTFNTGGGPNISNMPIGGGAASNIAPTARDSGGNRPYPVPGAPSGAGGGGGGAMPSAAPSGGEALPMGAGGLPGGQPQGSGPYGAPPMGGGLGAMPPQAGIRPTLQGQVSQNVGMPMGALPGLMGGGPMASAQRPDGSAMQVPLNPQGGPVQQAQAAGTPLMANAGNGLVPPPSPEAGGAMASAAINRYPQYTHSMSQPTITEQHMPAAVDGASLANLAAGKSATDLFLKAQKNNSTEALRAAEASLAKLAEQTKAIWTPMLDDLAQQRRRAVEDQTNFKLRIADEFGTSTAGVLGREIKLMDEAATPFNTISAIGESIAAAEKERHSGLLGKGRQLADWFNGRPSVAQRTAGMIPTAQALDKQELAARHQVISDVLAVDKALGDHISSIDKQLHEVRKAQLDAAATANTNMLNAIGKWVQDNDKMLDTLWGAQQKADILLQIQTMKDEIRVQIQGMREKQKEKEQERIDARKKMGIEARHEDVKIQEKGKDTRAEEYRKLQEKLKG